MKLGVAVGYSGAKMEIPVEHVVLAEQLGYDSVWTAEAYGSDAITPLAYLAAKTTHIRLGQGSRVRRSWRGGTASRGDARTTGSRTTSRSCRRSSSAAGRCPTRARRS